MKGWLKIKLAGPKKSFYCLDQPIFIYFNQKMKSSFF